MSNYYARFSREDRCWTVGCDNSEGTWFPIKDCSGEQEAVELIHYLHGGSSEQLASITQAIQQIAKTLDDDLLNAGRGV